MSNNKTPKTDERHKVNPFHRDPPPRWSGAEIFDQFPSMDAATGFSAGVKAATGWNSEVFENVHEAEAETFYPFQLTAPVVFVERSEFWQSLDRDRRTSPELENNDLYRKYRVKSDKVDQLCRKFGGVWAGS